jgi:gamma-glutamyltranspeptidase/glutathione hydrolase
VVDAEGNAFSATPSDATFDTPVIPGLGFALSSRGQQSWVDPEHTSSLQPGKRPRMTPNPSMVMKDGELFMPFGCPGGDRQAQAMVQVFLNIVEFGMNPQAAIEQPRIWSESFPNSFWPHNYPPGLLCVEGRVPVETRERLAAQGHKIQLELDWAHRSASVCAILVDRENGTLIGGADPRMDAYVIGW